MEFLRALVFIIRLIIEIYAVIIVVRIFVSLFVHKQNNLTAFIYRITEPVLKIFRKLLPRNTIGFDWSFVLAIVTLQIIIFLLMLLGNSLQ